MRRAARLAPFLMLLAAGSAGAQEDNAQCAVTTVAGALAADEGDCVSITAFVVDGRLVDDLLHRYAAEQRYNDASSSEVQLGLSGWSDDPAAVGAARVRVIGRVRRCGDSLSGDLLPKSGQEFCEQSQGLYLQASQAMVSGRTPMRRGLRRDGAMLGNLAPLPEGPLRQAISTDFRGALDKFRADQAAAMVTIFGKTPPDHFAAKAALADSAVVEIFGWRTPAWASAADSMALAQQGEAMADAVACAINPKLAEQNLWPISTRDIGITADRPYLCMRVTRHPDGRFFMNYSGDHNPSVEG